jgi:peroxiredoxin
MHPLQPGTAIPSHPDGVTHPGAIVFYKVTCPVCQMAAPKVDLLAGAYPGRVVAVGQDPEAELAEFRHAHGLDVPTSSDLAPYPLSEAFGIQVVPTLFVIDDDGVVVEVVESWDRDGFNNASRRLAELLGVEAAVISEEGDGLPPFRPG